MKLSIITVCFNSQNTLQRTIHSVASQTYPDIEYIIIDGESRDNTVRLIKENQSVINRWVSEPDEGIYDAMNKGIAMATGDVIGFLNSDDVFYNESAAATIMHRFNNPDIDIVHGGLNFINNKSKLVRTWQGSPYEPGAFARGWHPAHPTFYVRREVYAKLEPYDTTMPVAADFEMMLRAIEVHKFSSSFIDETLIVFSMGGNSTGSIRNILRGNREILKAFKKNNIKVNSLMYMIRRLIPKIANLIKFRFGIKS
jgi:glycosyltransferase involved in cell wall biosynthesis